MTKSLGGVALTTTGHSYGWQGFFLGLGEDT